MTGPFLSFLLARDEREIFAFGLCRKSRNVFARHLVSMRYRLEKVRIISSALEVYLESLKYLKNFLSVFNLTFIARTFCSCVNLLNFKIR